MELIFFPLYLLHCKF